MATLPLKSRDSIEIRELVIKASVRDHARQDNGQDVPYELPENLKKEVIEESVEKILSIIQNKNER